MNSYDRIFEEIKSPATKQRDEEDARKEKEGKTAASRLAKSGDTEKREAHLRTLRSSLRQKQRTQGATASIAARYGRDKPHPLEKQQIAASTETVMNAYEKICGLLTETKKNRGNKPHLAQAKAFGSGTKISAGLEGMHKHFSKSPLNIDILKNPDQRRTAKDLLVKHKYCVGSACKAMEDAEGTTERGLRSRSGTQMGAGRIDVGNVRANQIMKGK